MPISSKKKIQGIYYPPGDKSISHRSLILTGQAVGKSEINNLLEGEDVINTVLVMRELGVRIKKKKWKIHSIWHTSRSSISTKKSIRFWKFRDRYKTSCWTDFFQ